MNGSSSGVGRTCILLLLLCLSDLLYPQEVEEILRDRVEELLNNPAEELFFSEETADDLAGLLEEYSDRSPIFIDLNNATREQLSESNLFTPFQIQVLLKYRAEYGPFFSIYELAGLPGFRGSRLPGLEPYLTVGTGMVSVARDPRKLMLLVNGKRTFPPAKGFLPADTVTRLAPYAGNPLKTGVRCKASFSRTLSAAFGYEKDPGEDFFHQGMPEFLSGYISYRGTRNLRKLILGNFRLQHGLGIVNGSGFMTSLETFSLMTPYSPKLLPYAGLGESKYERGAASQLTLGKVDLMLWGSYRPIDLSLYQYPDIPVNRDWEELERTTGLHRTTNELHGRSLAFSSHNGVHASMQIGQLTVGAVWGMRINGLTTTGRDTLHLEDGPSGVITCGLEGAWYSNRFELSWELAITGNRSTAMLAGIRYHLNDFLQGFLLVHRYDSGYRGMFSSTYASGSQVYNDHGVALGWHLEGNSSLVADLKLELFRYPAPRYQTIVPSCSSRYGCAISNSGTGGFKWRFSLYRKSWQTTPSNHSPGIRPIEQWQLTRMEYRFNYNPGKMKWQSRIVLSWFQDQAPSLPDYAVAQSITFDPAIHFRSTVQLMVFRVMNWENRIYLHEPGLYYSFSFPVCNGLGERITWVIALKTGKRITLSGKLNTTVYHDRANTGSGLDQRQGNRKWEMELQFRLNL